MNFLLFEMFKLFIIKIIIVNISNIKLKKNILNNIEKKEATNKIISINKYIKSFLFVIEIHTYLDVIVSYYPSHLSIYFEISIIT